MKFGIFASIGARILTGYLAELKRAAPDVELEIWDANCEELQGALLNGQVDVALASALEAEHDERLRVIPLYRETYYVAFAPGHRFEAMDEVPLAELDGEDYVKWLHCEWPDNFEKLACDLPFKDLKTRYVGEREDWVQAMVKAGLGMAVMPEHLPILPGIVMRKLVDPVVSRPISLATVANRRHSAPVLAAMSAARRYKWPGSIVASEPDQAIGA